MPPLVAAALIALIGIIVGAALGFVFGQVSASMQYKRESQRRADDRAHESQRRTDDIAHEIKKIQEERTFSARQAAVANAVEAISRFVLYLVTLHARQPRADAPVDSEYEELGVAMERLHTYCSVPLLRQQLYFMRLAGLTWDAAVKDRNLAYSSDATDEERRRSLESCRSITRGRLLEIQCAARDFQVAARVDLGFTLQHEEYLAMMTEATKQAATVLFRDQDGPAGGQ